MIIDKFLLNDSPLEALFNGAVFNHFGISAMRNYVISFASAKALTAYGNEL